MISKNKFLAGLNSCVEMQTVENKHNYEACQFFNSLGIALYFYFIDAKGKIKHYDDREKFMKALNK